MRSRVGNVGRGVSRRGTRRNNGNNCRGGGSRVGMLGGRAGVAGAAYWGDIGVMRPAVCGPNGNPNCGGGRRSRRGGAGIPVGRYYTKGGSRGVRRSRRGGRMAADLAGVIDPKFRIYGGGAPEFRPAVCGEGGWGNC